MYSDRWAEYGITESFVLPPIVSWSYHSIFLNQLPYPTSLSQMWWRERSMPTPQPNYPTTRSVQNISRCLRRQESRETVSQINIPTYKNEQLQWCVHIPCDVTEWRWWVVERRTPYIGCPPCPILSTWLFSHIHTSTVWCTMPTIGGGLGPGRSDVKKGGGGWRRDHAVGWGKQQKDAPSPALSPGRVLLGEKKW